MRPICQFWRRFIRGSSMSVCTTETSSTEKRSKSWIVCWPSKCAPWVDILVCSLRTTGMPENWCVENSLNLWSKQLPVWSHTVRIFVVSKSEHKTDQLSRERYGRHSEETPAWTRHVFDLFAKYSCCNLDRICGRKSARLALRL